MREGAVIDYEIRLAGLPVAWRTLITATDDGGTRLTDEVRYALPLGPLGDVVHALAIRRQLRVIFDYRHEVVAHRCVTGG
jgi:ligand-binding SRPBCC domain-containing protein